MGTWPPVKPAFGRARLLLSFEPINFDVLNGVEGVEICWLYIVTVHELFVKQQFFRCLDVITFNFLTLRMRMKLVPKPSLPIGGDWICTGLIWSPKKAPLGYHVQWGYVTKNRLEFFIETESHMFKRKIVLKDVSKDALLFFHIFCYSGGRNRCVTWDGFMLFYWSFAHVRQRPRVVQAARRLGEIPGNWDLFRCL